MQLLHKNALDILIQKTLNKSGTYSGDSLTLKVIKKGAYVYYEFVMDEAGVVDFIWNIAGSNWNSSTNSNDGLTDMAAHMTVTIDGIPVDISGIALSSEGQYQWWNLQNLIIDNVSLDAGVHTFKCDVTAAGGLNVASMTINSTSDVYVRSADVTFVNNGFANEEIKFWHNASTSYDIAYFDTVNGVTTIKIDVTDLGLATQINHHLSFAGKNYVNGANANGEIDHNDGGRVNWEYKCKPTLDPRLMLTEKGNTNTLATHDVLMRSFVLEKGESATYAFTSSYSGLSWFSDFKVVKFSTTPYTV